MKEKSEEKNREIIEKTTPEIGKKKKAEEQKGLVFSIQAHSVHDGPGTRTTVFLNGCPLRCVWCCNPEGLFNKPVMLHSDQKCQHCGSCMTACPYGAVTIENGQCRFDRAKCDKCETMECVEACYHEGNSITGKYYTITELMRFSPGTGNSGATRAE